MSKDVATFDFDSVLNEVEAKKARARKGNRLESIYDYIGANPGCTHRDVTKSLFQAEFPNGLEGVEVEDAKKRATIYSSAVTVALGESQAGIKNGDFEMTVEDKDGKLKLVARA